MSGRKLPLPKAVSMKKIQESPRGVRRLSLQKLNFITDASFRCFLELMPNLTSLSLAECPLKFREDPAEVNPSGLSFQNVLRCVTNSRSNFTSLDFSRT